MQSRIERMEVIHALYAITCSKEDNISRISWLITISRQNDC